MLVCRKLRGFEEIREWLPLWRENGGGEERGHDHHGHLRDVRVEELLDRDGKKGGNEHAIPKLAID